MKDQHLPSFSPDNRRFTVEDLCFGENGPYSFSCAGGTCLGMSGASGVGKTLLLRALADLDSHRGRVLLDDRESASYPGPEWRRLVALVPAESRWWYPEVGPHFPVGPGVADAVPLLLSCGFEEDVLNWQVNRLSTGEKQRLAVVRALVRNPEVLLLDETGSGLDLGNGLLVEKAIENYRRTHNAPVIWVSHDKEQLARVSTHLATVQRDRLDLSVAERSLEERL